tara:strand:- start:3071 stop:3280 length:210 start_codon:yes stop_codon:yes gene_type:complete
MSFNKKYINKEALIERFKLEGYQGVISYIGKADAIIGLTDDLEEILDISHRDICPTQKNDKIKKIINGE